MTFKILHCGDVHLDSPFAAVSATDISRAAERRRGLCRVFERSMRLAAERGCAAVLIAGDLFDRSYISPDTAAAMIKAIGEAGCPVVVSPGNHDPCTDGSIWATRKKELPGNLYVFDSPELSCFELPGADIDVWGYAFTSERMDRSPLTDRGSLSRAGRIALLCAHADITSPMSRYAPITPRELADSGAAYAALGHVHNPPEPERYGETLAAYCGFPEGRGFDEQGFGTVNIVTIEDGRAVDIERVRVGEHRYLIVDASVEGAENDDAAATLACETINELSSPENTSLRLRLCGAVDTEYIPNTASIAEKLASGAGASLYALEVEDDTLPLLGGGTVGDDMTLRGEFYRTLVSAMKEGDAHERRVAADALRIGLRALDGRL